MRAHDDMHALTGLLLRRFRKLLSHLSERPDVQGQQLQSLDFGQRPPNAPDPVHSLHRRQSGERLERWVVELKFRAIEGGYSIRIFASMMCKTISPDSAHLSDP